MAEKQGTLKKAKETVFVTSSERETFHLAKKLAGGFKGEEVVFLIGDLGAGKTVFAKGIASGLGLKDVHQVCSPSFTLVNVYQAKYLIFHIDLYRLNEASEIFDLGWEDYLSQGVVLVEWAEKMPFEVKAIRIVIETGRGDERKIRVEYS